MSARSSGVRVSAVLVAAASALAACGSGDGGSEDAGDTVAVTAEPVAEEPVVGTEAAEPADDESESPANEVPAEIDDPAADEAGSKSVVTRSPDAEGDGVSPEGFTTVTARVTSADGEVCEVCLWLADSAEERGTGLMGVTDLGGPVGMVFAWDTETAGRFFMLDTPTPLSIAWFGADGGHVGQADMDPCITDDSAECERYSPDASYTHAVEMFAGQLDVVGIGPGSTFEVLPGSESPTCEL